jgi:mRNA interferase RelE/StbE
MKAEFLKQFYKDLDKINLESVKNDISDAITNVENASKPPEIKGIKKLSGYKYAFRI